VSNDLQMMMFDIEGKAEMRNTTNTEVDKPDAARTNEVEANAVNKLNEEAEIICDRIERGVKKLLPPYVTVQANIQFEQGSLLIAGTVAVFAWAGSVALETAKAEVQQQIASLVKTVVQRVINRAVVSRGLQRNITSMEMTVKPQQLIGASRAGQAVAETTPSDLASAPDAKSIFPIRRHVYVLYALFAFVLLAEVILTLSKFFTIRFR